MSSYKGHTLFGLILSLLFFINPVLIALCIIGANIPDFDHKYKKERVYQIIILGLVVFIALYILKLPYHLGLLIVFMGLIFLFSNHRSFTHSIFGLLTLTATVSLALIMAYELIIATTLITDVNSYFMMLILVMLLAFLFLNKKLFIIFLPLLLLLQIATGVGSVSYIQIAIALFLGIFSHIVLDSFTPSGIKLFAPISNKKVHKTFGIISIIVILAIFIFFAPDSFLLKTLINIIH